MNHEEAFAFMRLPPLARVGRGVVAHHVHGMNAHSHLFARLIDVDAVVLFNGLDGLAAYMNIILDVQAIVFTAFDHAVQPQLVIVRGAVDADALQPDEVVLRGVQLHRHRLPPLPGG